jgi:uncharacterized membrane protein
MPKVFQYLTKSNLLVITLFSAIYGFLNPTLSMIISQATGHQPDTLYNAEVILYAIIVLTVVTVIGEYWYTKKHLSKDVADRFLIANITLIAIMLVSLKTANYREEGSPKNAKPISEMVFYCILFIHIFVAKILSLIFLPRLKKHAK